MSLINTLVSLPPSHERGQTSLCRCEVPPIGWTIPTASKMQDKRNQPSSRTNEPSWRARGRGRGSPDQRGVLSGPSKGVPGPRTQQISSFPGLQNARRAIATPQASTPEASRRQMNFMASVSRSSGLEKDGDDLKNPSVQEEYRKFIQGKVDKILQDRSRNTLETDLAKSHRIEAQQNVLILFRKLREGVSSTNRRDRFALEVYETSLYLSILFEAPAQTISILPHLFVSRSSDNADGLTFVSGSPSPFSALCVLLHHLVEFYPSQRPYMQQLQALSNLPRDSALSQWLQTLTRSLRFRNYARFSRLSDDSVVKNILDGSAGASEYHLGLQATLLLISTLKEKVSESAWTMIRAAYREFSTGDDAAETRRWLGHLLCLASPIERWNSSEDLPVKSWLESRESMGQIRRKENVEGRWHICKVR